MTGDINTFVPAQPPAGLAELRAMAARTGQHRGCQTWVTEAADGTVTVRVAVYRVPVGKQFPGHFVGTASARPREGRLAPAAVALLCERAELVAVLKAYPEFEGVAAAPEPRAA